MSSIIKKLIMAITGGVLASFLAVHMLGNLQALEGGPHAINVYAHFLQTLPWEILWGFRLTLFVCIIVHFALAFILVLENSKARPQKYAVKKSIIPSKIASTMIYTGVLIFAFAAVHILHYTVMNIHPELKHLEWLNEDGKAIHDVYAMLVVAFSNDFVAIFYIAAMAFIGFHLTHGVASVFQSVGFRNEVVRGKIKAIAAIYAIVVFGGFSINPAMVLICKYTNLNLPLGTFPVNQILQQYETKKSNDKEVFIDYAAIEKCAPCCEKK